jgi:hypothetical protein
MMRLQLLVITTLLLCLKPGELFAQLEAGKEPPPVTTVSEAKPVVDAAAAKKRIKDLGDGNYELGQITFNAKRREIRVPCVINMREGPIEFVLVHESGKTHESLLRTGVSALDLQVIFLLLNYEPGHDGLFDSLEKKEPEAYANLVKVKTTKAGANRIKLGLEVSKDQEVKPLAQCLLKLPAKKPPTDCDTWIFHGSMVQESGFSAALHGNLISLYYDVSGMIGTPSLDNRTDDCWEPNPLALPEEKKDAQGNTLDNEVTLLISPEK